MEVTSDLLMTPIARAAHTCTMRAQTLEELLEKHHTTEMLGGKPISPVERADLIEFLKSL